MDKMDLNDYTDASKSELYCAMTEYIPYSMQDMIVDEGERMNWFDQGLDEFLTKYQTKCDTHTNKQFARRVRAKMVKLVYELIVEFDYLAKPGYEKFIEENVKFMSSLYEMVHNARHD